ncbi:MAG: hypothetical protein IT380_15695 [Myxococcales bacterium]|nr:hypothetical protein [Myxococcales bacterium]
MRVPSVLLCTLLAAPALAGEKPTIVYKNPPAGDEERPVMTEIVVGPQGSDYAFKLEFNKAPWGEECGTRCANATLFLDTDNNKSTGLKLSDPKAPETGADIALTIQGTKDLHGGVRLPTLKVKVVQYAEDATTVEQGMSLAELDPKVDTERVLAEGTSVYLLLDANIGNLPSGQKLRVVYHPPDSKPLVGMAKGLSAPGANRVEIFKDGKLSNPVKKKKSAYEKY